MRVLLIIYMMLILAPGPLLADVAKSKQYTKNHRVKSSLVMNAANGNILHARGSWKTVKPASLVKLMTLYVAFDEIKKGNLTLDKQFTVSKRAASVVPYKLCLEAGRKISVQELINALIVCSANDAAITLAEGISGTEGAFAKKMNVAAKKLGMLGSKFQNASGLNASGQYTTSRDMAKLTNAIRRNFPDKYDLFKQKIFKIDGRTILSHNHVTKEYNGAEGMKTGYTYASGYNLVTTARRGNIRLLGVVIGEDSVKIRDDKMKALLNKCFARCNNKVKKRQVSKKSLAITSLQNKSKNHGQHQSEQRNSS